MVRKGWTQVEVPGRWLQLIRGPRPKSEQRPMSLEQSVRRPGVPEASSQEMVEWRPSTSRRCECRQGSRVRHGSPRARGTGLEAALRRVKEQTQAGVSPSRAPVPEVTFKAARVKCETGSSSRRHSRLPRAGSRCLQAALTRTKAAVPPPLECRSFSANSSLSGL